MFIVTKRLDGSRCHLAQSRLSPGDSVLDEDPARRGSEAGDAICARHTSVFNLLRGDRFCTDGVKLRLVESSLDFS